jgi:TetR/AcrR family transcriptional repressor of nem operon
MIAVVKQLKPRNHDSKTRLLNAALLVIRARGYSDTRIEDVCHAARLTKGSFFHHFKSKEELALAAAEHFYNMADSLFTTAPYRSLKDPLDRLLGYVDFRKALLEGTLPEFTCLFGTMVQETYQTHPLILEACARNMAAHAAMLEADIAAAMDRYGVHAAGTAESLALYMQAVLQGAFILAKATGGPAVVATCLDHLHRYIELLFKVPKPLEFQEDEIVEKETG